MADLTCNIAKGRVVELYNRVKSNDPAASVLTLVVLEISGDQDDAVRDADTLADVIALSNVLEVTNANYARVELTDSDLAALSAPDDTNNRRDVAIPDTTWSAVGAGDSWTDVLVCYDESGAGADANMVPLVLLDFAVVPSGSDITALGTNIFRAS